MNVEQGATLVKRLTGATKDSKDLKAIVSLCWGDERRSLGEGNKSIERGCFVLNGNPSGFSAT